MNKKIILALAIILVLIVVLGGVFYFWSASQPIVPEETNNGISRGMYSRLESGVSDSDISQSTLGEIIKDQIRDIQITEYYGGWSSIAEARKELLDKLNDKNIIVSSSPLWNLDTPVQLVGTIEYGNGVRGIVVVVQHRVGFRDNSGESWYFQWDERWPLTTDTRSSELTSCERFMGSDSDIFQYKTDDRVLSGCDNKSFVELSHEYGKDKNFVYFRPMPNANKMTIILEGADPKTFELLGRCPGLSADKNHVYQIGKIVENKNPTMLKGSYIEDNSETYCY